MSLNRRALNLVLSVSERRYLARLTEPLEARESFERKARFWFRAPRGSHFEERRLGDVPATWVRGPGSDAGGVLLYFHGGGYFMGSPRTHRAMLAQLSAMTGLPACLPDYRLAPEHVFPAAFDDAMTAYRALLEQGVRAETIVLGGDSAGGGLALALLAGLLREAVAPPRMSFAFSPLTDLALTGRSLATNRDSEVLLPAERMAEVAERYLSGADPRDPRASPLYADFTGSGPVLLYASASEILLDDTRRMAREMERQGVEVTQVIEPGLPHVWPMFHNLLPEARATLADLASRIAP